jgi:hypothetical protein
MKRNNKEVLRANTLAMTTRGNSTLLTRDVEPDTVIALFKTADQTMNGVKRVTETANIVPETRSNLGKS